MIVYSQRLKFSIILGVLLISIFSVIWYSNNLNTKMEYIDKRIDFLDANPLYVARLWDNLRHICTYADNRYESQREWFRQLINQNINAGSDLLLNI